MRQDNRVVLCRRALSALTLLSFLPASTGLQFVASPPAEKHRPSAAYTVAYAPGLQGGARGAEYRGPLPYPGLPEHWEFPLEEEKSLPPGNGALPAGYTLKSLRALTAYLASPLAAGSPGPGLKLAQLEDSQDLSALSFEERAAVCLAYVEDGKTAFDEERISDSQESYRDAQRVALGLMQEAPSAVEQVAIVRAYMEAARGLGHDAQRQSAEVLEILCADYPDSLMAWRARTVLAPYYVKENANPGRGLLHYSDSP